MAPPPHAYNDTPTPTPAGGIVDVAPPATSEVLEECRAAQEAIFRELEKVVEMDAFSIFLAVPRGAGFTHSYRVEREEGAIRERHPGELPQGRMRMLQDIAAGQPKLISVASAAPVDPLADPPTRSPSKLYAPVAFCGRVIAVYGAENWRPDAFSKADLDRFCVTAGRTGAALHQVDLLQRLARQATRLEELHRIIAELGELPDKRRVIRRALEECSVLLGAEFGLYRENDGGQLRVREAIGFPAGVVAAEADIALSDSPHFAGMFVRREALEDHTGAISPRHKELGVRSVLSVPIKRGDQLIGTFFFGSASNLAFPPEQRQIMTRLAVQIGGVLETAWLRDDLVASQARFDAVFELCDMGILLASHSGTVMSWNAAARNAFGHSPEEMRGAHLLTLFSGGWRKRVSAYLEHPGKAGPLILPDAKLKRFDAGTRFLAEATLAALRRDRGPVAPGGGGASAESVAGYTLIFRPLTGDAAQISGPSDPSASDTGQRRTIAAATGTTYRAVASSNLLHHMAQLTYVALPSRPWTVLAVEGQPEKIFGCTGLELTQAPDAWESAVLLEDRSEYERRFDCAQHGGALVLQYRLRHPTEGILLVQDFVQPVRGATGVVERLEGALQLGRLDEEIAQRLRDQERRLSLAIFAGGMAQELNNIGVGIESAGDFALNMVDETEPVAKYLRLIKRAGRRSRRLVAKLLYFSQLRRASSRKLDLNRLVVEHLGFLAIEMAAGALVQPSLEEGLPAVMGDAEQIAAALAFLVENAYEAQRREGRLVVYTRVHDAADGLPGVDGEVAPGRYVALGVADQGRGFSPGDRAALLDPFVTSKGGGRGLGLAATASIARAADGYLGLQAREPIGARFALYFPELPLATTGALVVEGSSEHPRVGDRAVASAQRVLVLESVGTIRDLATAIIEHDGREVLAARSLIEAATVLRQQMGDIALLVVGLPDDEQEAAHWIRDLRAINPMLRIVAMEDRRKMGLEVMAAGDPHLTLLLKPFTRDQLSAAVKELMP